MALTSDERREVAASLREQADEGYGVNLESMLYALGLDTDDEERGDEDVFEMLADLIDPTCEVEGSEPLYMDDETEFRLSCGHVADMTTNEPPAYCPECGARVTGCDGR